MLAFADFYDNLVYTIVKKDSDIADGIGPSDQGLYDRGVFLWMQKDELLKYSSTVYDYFEVKLDERTKSFCKRLGNGFVVPRIFPSLRILKINPSARISL